jgi:hypothetical protein
VPLCFGFVILYLDLLILYQRAKGPKRQKVLIFFFFF